MDEGDGDGHAPAAQTLKRKKKSANLGSDSLAQTTWSEPQSTPHGSSFRPARAATRLDWSRMKPAQRTGIPENLLRSEERRSPAVDEQSALRRPGSPQPTRLPENMTLSQDDYSGRLGESLAELTSSEHGAIDTRSAQTEGLVRPEHEPTPSTTNALAQQRRLKLPLVSKPQLSLRPSFLRPQPPKPLSAQQKAHAELLKTKEEKSPGAQSVEEKQAAPAQLVVIPSRPRQQKSMPSLRRSQHATKPSLGARPSVAEKAQLKSSLVQPASEPTAAQRPPKKRRSVIWSNPVSQTRYIDAVPEAGAAQGSRSADPSSVESIPDLRGSGKQQTSELLDTLDNLTQSKIWDETSDWALARQNQDRVDKMKGEWIPRLDKSIEQARHSNGILEQETNRFAAELQSDLRVFDDSDEEKELAQLTDCLQATRKRLETPRQDHDVDESSFDYAAPDEEQDKSAALLEDAQREDSSDDVVMQLDAIAHEAQHMVEEQRVETEDDEMLLANLAEIEAGDAAIGESRPVTRRLVRSTQPAAAQQSQGMRSGASAANTQVKRGRGSSSSRETARLPVVVRRDDRWVSCAELPAAVADLIDEWNTLLYEGRAAQHTGRFARRPDSLRGTYCVQCEVILHDKGKCPKQESQAYTACARCVSTSRPCAILVEDGDGVRLGWLPLPADRRGYASWGDKGYWIKE